MSGKIISCVISCYNEEENLPTLLNQINSNQLEKKIEFVIVNNGSTDNSWNIILENKKLFPEIKFIVLNIQMDKVNKLDNIQFVVSELVSSIKQDIHNEESIIDESLSYLTTRVEKLNSCDSQFFTAGYNILVLKQAINTLLTIVKEQDKRIRELEQKH